MTQREISFEREIDINATIKNITESGFGRKYQGYADKPVLFEKEKSIKEVKSKVIWGRRGSGTYVLFMFIGMIMMIGIFTGFVIRDVIIDGVLSALTICMAWLALLVVIMLSLSVRHIAKKLNKWIYFPSPTSVTFAGNFTEDDVNTFKKFVILKKSKV